MSEETGWVGLAGVVVGGLLTTGATYWLEHLRNSRASESLAAAFRGEIQALRKVVAQRKYAQHLRTVVEHITNTGTGWPNIGVRIEQDYFSVFRSNTDKIGTLSPPLPTMVAEFYTCATAILEDLKVSGSGALSSSTPDQQLSFYKGLLVLMEETMHLADRTIAQIESIYPTVA